MPGSNLSKSRGSLHFIPDLVMGQTSLLPLLIDKETDRGDSEWLARASGQQSYFVITIDVAIISYRNHSKLVGAQGNSWVWIFRDPG